MQFGKYIRGLREARGMTLVFAARELGTTPQRLCDIEQGRRNFRDPPFDLLRKIAAVYEHPYSNLVTNSEFFSYEKSIVSELLGNLEPLAIQLEARSLSMLIEARQYTPEMEALAEVTHRAATDLKLALLLARSRISGGPTGKTPAGSRTRRTG